MCHRWQTFWCVLNWYINLYYTVKYTLQYSILKCIVCVSWDCVMHLMMFVSCMQYILISRCVMRHLSICSFSFHEREVSNVIWKECFPTALNSSLQCCAILVVPLGIIVPWGLSLPRFIIEATAMLTDNTVLMFWAVQSTKSPKSPKMHKYGHDWQKEKSRGW